MCENVVEADIQSLRLPDSHCRDTKIPFRSFILRPISLMVLSTLESYLGTQHQASGSPKSCTPLPWISFYGVSFYDTSDICYSLYFLLSTCCRLLFLFLLYVVDVSFSITALCVDIPHSASALCCRHSTSYFCYML